MKLSICPYCSQPGMVTTVKVHGHGLEVSGKCATCGYTVSSEYDSAELADDLPGEFSRSLEKNAAD